MIRWLVVSVSLTHGRRRLELWIGLCAQITPCQRGITPKTERETLTHTQELWFSHRVYVIPLQITEWTCCVIIPLYSPFLSVHPQVHHRQTGRSAGDPGVGLAHVNFHEVTAVPSA